MLQYMEKRWNEYQRNLREELKKEKCYETIQYKTILRLIVRCIFNAERKNPVEWDEGNIHICGSLEYQGIMSLTVTRNRAILRPEDMLCSYISDTEDQELIWKMKMGDFDAYMELCKKIVCRFNNPYGYNAQFEEFYRNKLTISKTCVEYLKPCVDAILRIYPRIALNETRLCKGLWLPYAWVTNDNITNEKLGAVPNPVEMKNMKKRLVQLVSRTEIEEYELSVVKACNQIIDECFVESVPLLDVINGKGVNIVEDEYSKSPENTEMIEKLFNCIVDEVQKRTQKNCQLTDVSSTFQ